MTTITVRRLFLQTSPFLAEKLDGQFAPHSSQQYICTHPGLPRRRNLFGQRVIVTRAVSIGLGLYQVDVRPIHEMDVAHTITSLKLTPYVDTMDKHRTEGFDPPWRGIDCPCVVLMRFRPGYRVSAFICHASQVRDSVFYLSQNLLFLNPDKSPVMQNLREALLYLGHLNQLTLPFLMENQ